MFRKTTSKRNAFFVMVSLMLVSAILAFTVLRTPNPENFPKMPTLAMPSSAGLGKTLSVYQDLEQMELLSQQVKAVLRKKRLTDSDSLLLKSKLKQIDSIYKRASAH